MANIVSALIKKTNRADQNLVLFNLRSQNLNFFDRKVCLSFFFISWVEIVQQTEWKLLKKLSQHQQADKRNWEWEKYFKGNSILNMVSIYFQAGMIVYRKKSFCMWWHRMMKKLQLHCFHLKWNDNRKTSKSAWWNSISQYYLDTEWVLTIWLTINFDFI